MKKLAIIGAGTAGCLTASHFLRFTDWAIDWYIDSSIKPQAVGEGSNLVLPKALYNNINFTILDLEKIDGTFKTGLKKQNWGKINDTFYHLFVAGNVGYHFNAVKLQNYLRHIFESNPRITTIDKKVVDHNIDSDFILDCSGSPHSLTDKFYKAEHIPVNSVYVTQCMWEYQKFNYTLTIARPYGWVFGIPLQNRCAIGYMYNNNITTLEDIKTDVINIFKEYELNPSNTTNSFSFKNYYRKNNYSKTIAYNGNASFFLEPLEATSIHFMDICNRCSYDVFNNNISAEEANYYYLNKIREIENVIMLHYLAGSSWDTKFWNMAENLAKNNIATAKNNTDFINIINLAKNYNINKNNQLEYGTWDLYSFPININALGIWNQLEHL